MNPINIVIYYQLSIVKLLEQCGITNAIPACRRMLNLMDHQRQKEQSLKTPNARQQQRQKRLLLEQRLNDEETYKYVLKEHQRDANTGRHQRPRTTGTTNKYTAAQNFILTPIIRLEHLLIKKKACGGARSFYVIDTDKKQLIEVEANSKDDLEK